MGKQVDIISLMFQLRPDDMHIRPWQQPNILLQPDHSPHNHLPILQTALQTRHQQNNVSPIFYHRYPIRRQRHSPSAI